MSWTDLDSQELAKVSYPGSGKGLAIIHEEGPARIVVEAMPQHRGHSMLIRLPKELHERLEAAVVGSTNAAVNAFIEQALDDLEAGGQTWKVVPGHSTGSRA